MGTSKSSSTIQSVYSSIQQQLEAIFNINNNDNKEYEKMKKELFADTLAYVSREYLNETNLVILLDSIDQLSNQDDFDLHWMFKRLPKNVKIIYSVLNTNLKILEILKKKIESHNILEIETLSQDEGKRILYSYLKASNRKLTEKQEESINKLFNHLENICPLQIKLIFDIISKWKSSVSASEEFIECKTSIEIIQYLFRVIEKEIFDNEVLFKHCMYYLTFFEFRGISENELEDILSIDDDVLNSIFKHHHPPVRRFPLALWYRLKYELREYITNKTVDDASVVAWLVIFLNKNIYIV